MVLAAWRRLSLKASTGITGKSHDDEISLRYPTRTLGNLFCEQNPARKGDASSHYSTLIAHRITDCTLDTIDPFVEALSAGGD